MKIILVNKKCRIILFAIILLFFIFNSNALSTSYNSYNYNFWGDPVPSPDPYIPVGEYYHENIEGLKSLDNPQDLFVDSDNNIYIVDSGNNSIIILNDDWEVKRVIDQFTSDGNVDEFNNPRGIFVTDKGEIYIADKNNARIIKLDNNYEYVEEIDSPAGTGLFSDDYDFLPEKVGVDNAGRIYVVSEDEYNGLMVFDTAGQFTGFIGAPKVTPSKEDLFWRMIGTETQRARRTLSLPIQYNNIAIDDRGFIYGTISMSSENNMMIRKLNSSGTDILRRNGFHPIIGDVQTPPNWLDDWLISFEGPSRFVDVVLKTDDVYGVLDRNRGRIFTYNQDGYLLHVFGGPGDQRGLFKRPVAIEIMNEQLLVLDNESKTITVFKSTEYNNKIMGAISAYKDGYYNLAADKWREVLRLNSNLEIAYTGVGQSYFRQENYESAMSFFRLGQNRDSYSDVFNYYRREVIEQEFSTIIYSLLIVILILFLIYLIKTRDLIARIEKTSFAKGTFFKIKETFNSSYFGRKLKNYYNSLRYSLYLIFHPFDGFWELKRGDAVKNKYFSTIFILTMVIFTYVFMRQRTGFVFNYNDLSQLNIFTETFSILVPYILFCMVNWSLTTLMDGKGNMKDLFVSIAFSLTPLIIVYIPLTIISNYLLAAEGGLYYGMLSFGLFWSGSILFFSTMITHDYSLQKTIFTFIATIFGMILVLFLGLLLYSLFEQIIGFVLDIYSEIIFRW
ncbi:MAG: YIP1 family protein [bacterium]